MPIKLDIGSGYMPKSKSKGDYICIDKFVKDNADVMADILALPFDNCTIDEIWCEHTLEHLPEKDVLPALLEMRRILDYGGVLELRVPDIVWTMEQFLSAEQEQRWGIWKRRVFGAQIHPGEFHLTGFDVEKVKRLLVGAGFYGAEVEVVFSHRHNQPEIRGEAIK